MSSDPTQNPPQLLPSALPRNPSGSKSPSPSLSLEPALRVSEPPDEPQPNNEDEIPYPEVADDGSLLPPQDFHPFFTIIEDSVTGEHYHPSVHYVFADDDPAIVTAASMRALGVDDSAYLPSTHSDSPQSRTGGGRAEDTAEHTESPLPPPIPGVNERYLLLDIAADGHTILEAQSLSSDWAVTETDTRPAPSFDEDGRAEGLMLRVEGIEAPGPSRKQKDKEGRVEKRMHEARERAGGDVFVALEELVKGAEREGEVARKVVRVRERDKEDEGDEGLDPETEKEKVEVYH